MVKFFLMNIQHTCTISQTKLKPPGPIRDPANKYPVMTCKICNKKTYRKLVNQDTLEGLENKEYIGLYQYNQTGCPAQANAMPPQVAETMTTTKSDISLQSISTKKLH